MRILCACCLKIEPPEGWFFIDETMATYCTRECRDAHFEFKCRCWNEPDFFEMSDEKAEHA